MKSCELFELNRKSRILLYGAASIGGILFKKLSDEGFNVVGFIDKRAEEIKHYYNRPVYTIFEGPANKQECIVLIAVKNVFEHTRIASDLRREGYEKIVYRPYRALNGDSSGTYGLMNQCYTDLTLADLSEISKVQIPVVNDDDFLGTEITGVSHVEKMDKYLVYVPVTMVFTDRKDNKPEFSVLFLKPHINFIKYILGYEGGEYDSYLKYCEYAAYNSGNILVTEKWKENVIRNRAEVITNMNHRLNVEHSFFERNAPDAKWNAAKKAFNLNSGKHRTVFLAANGFYYIPLKVSEIDYKSYLSYIDAEELSKKFTGTYVSGYCPPVENPYFCSESWAVECFWFGVVKTVMNVLMNALYIDTDIDVFRGKKAVVQIPDGGLINRFFERMGLEIFEEKYDQDSFLFSIRWEERKDDHRRLRSTTKYDFVISGSNELNDYKRIGSWFYKNSTMSLFFKEFI